MKLSHNWLKNYLSHDQPPERIAELLTNTGLEVEHFASKSTVPGGLAGLRIGRVDRVWPHPNADNLSLTKVDVGDDESLQIVCGAPNVAEGQKVVVAPPGTTIYPSQKEPFQVKQTKIRGESSHGMICAEDEIGLGANHDGILVLPDEVEVGQSAASYFDIGEDTVYEIDLTPNRAEAMSHIGSARDLKAAMNVLEPERYKLQLPFPTSFQPDNHDLPIEVDIQDPEACPRYSGLTISNIQVQESPQWLKNRLLSVDIRPVNNIVDITNFILQEAGQPLHAFDAAKIKGQKVIVQTLPEGTSFQTLDGETRSLSEHDLMICNRQEGMCIAGVFGGAESGVTEDTTSIFLESAYFHPKYIRNTSFRHNLRTDAAIRFEKGTDPDITVKALQRAALMIKEMAGGEISSDVVDVYPSPIPVREITLRFDKVYRLTGLHIHPNTITYILKDLGIEIAEENEDELHLKVPPFRVDVTREADVIEEILRIYGYDEIPMPEQLVTSLSFSSDKNKEHIRREIASYLAANGFFEIMNSSITNQKYYEKLAPDNKEGLIPLLNSMTSELNAMRENMLFSSLETVLYNQNRGQQSHRYFEMGRIYWQSEEGYQEAEKLTLVMAGRRNGEGWRQWADDKTDFFHMKGYILNMLEVLGIDQWQEDDLDDAFFAYGLRFSNEENQLVSFGKVDDTLLAKWDIHTDVFFAEWHWEEALSLANQQTVTCKSLPKYPQSRRDLSLLVQQGVRFADIRKIAAEEGGQLLENITLFDIYSDEKMEQGEQSYCVGYIFRDPEKTLTDDEVDEIMNTLMTRYQNELGVQIR